MQLLFNASKTKCIFIYKTQNIVFDKDVKYMKSPSSRDILNRYIESVINTFNRKCIN